MPTFLGTVQDVSGATLSVALEGESAPAISFVDGQGYRIGQVGSVVRIPMGLVDLFGIVSQVGAGSVPANLSSDKPFGLRWMTVQLVGEAVRGGAFSRGVSQYPTIGDKVHLATEAELLRIHTGGQSPNWVRIGNIASADSVPAYIDLNRVVNRHSLVVGTTGSGKSTTVCALLEQLTATRNYEAARVVVLDIHGEYASALKSSATVFKVSTDSATSERPLAVPYWAMGFEELVAGTLGEVDDLARAEIADRVLEMKRESLRLYPRRGVSPETITVDSPIPFSIHKLWFDLHRLVYATHTLAGANQNESTEALELDTNSRPVEPGDPMSVTPPKYKSHIKTSGGEKIFLSSSNLNIRRQVVGLAAKLRDPRFSFLFRPDGLTPELDGRIEIDLPDLLAAWLGSDTPIVVLDLSGIPSGITGMIIGSLLRILYDSLSWGKALAGGGRERPLLVVLEEAHNYLSAEAAATAASRMVRRIVKEGRKYGVGAMIVSQRPAEIDSTIISQCGTIFALRLSNSRDRGHVTETVSDSLEGLMAMLPSLRTGEALVVGEATSLPMRVLIELPRQGRPDSDDPVVYNPAGAGGWEKKRSPVDYDAVVQCWRSQNYRIERRSSMQRVAVDSSNLVSVGYDSGTSTLEVEFMNGKVYQYLDVPATLHDEMMSASSKGSFLNEQIKPGYRYVLL